MQEQKIGNVILNYEFYKGQDEYSDGDIEDELLEMIKHESDVLKILQSDSRWPVLYHFSPVRQNIIDWYPMKENANVLEIGAGCGAISGALCKKAKKVVAVDLSKRRSMINAYRNKEFDNLEIIVANFNDVDIEEKFDYITLIGVLEYADYYTEGRNSFSRFLTNIKHYLKEDGKLLIAIENKFGLKYWAGFSEDHTGMYYEGLEGYNTTTSKVRTFGKKGLEDIIKLAGYNDINFYYPMPDYKFPTQIFSEDYLPKESDVLIAQDAYDNNRIRIFNDELVMNGIIEEDKFSFFSNSYFVEVSL